MDLPAFALHIDRFGVNFIARSRFIAFVHTIGLLYLWQMRFWRGLNLRRASFDTLYSFAFARANSHLFVHGFGLWQTSFGEDFVSSEQALARLYLRWICFWRGLYVQQVCFGAVCV